MPVFCQERALRAMLQEPSKYFNYAVQWLMNSDLDRIQRLDEKVRDLQTLFTLIQSTPIISNSKGLTETLRDIRTSTYQS